MNKNVPNILTIARLVMLPFLVGVMLIPAPWALWTAFGIYIAGAVTDFLDGYIARKYNLASDFGALFDPIADKVFVMAAMIMLIAIGHIGGVWTVAVIIILAREFLVSALREFLGPRNIKLPVTKLAKWKTTTQMIAVGILIPSPLIPFGFEAGLAFLAAATILTLITGTIYLQSALQHIKL